MVPRKVMHLELRFFVAADPEPGGRFIDVWEVALHDYLHKPHETGVLKCSQLLLAKPRYLSKTKYTLFWEISKILDDKQS